MSEYPSQGIAAILAAFPLTGAFGADKYYVGLTNLGIIQTILALTVVGLSISVPWAWLSTVLLVFAILSRGVPKIFYPGVDWAPTTTFDNAVAWVIVGLFVVSIIGGIMYNNCEKKCDKICEEKCKEEESE